MSYHIKSVKKQICFMREKYIKTLTVEKASTTKAVVARVREGSLGSSGCTRALIECLSTTCNLKNMVLSL